jgi:CDP-paratose 2-epimerase
VNGVGLVEQPKRWAFEPGMAGGIPETFPIDHCEHTPYGVSKLTGDLYMQDYAHLYGIKIGVFRMSCIYGTRQFGLEDQGWVAWFTIAALLGKPITIFGDGKQVRDVLYVDDAVDAYLLARARIGALGGRAFNLGGGLRNTVSLLELLARFTELGLACPQVRFAPWRPGDQRYYVSDTAKFERLTGWRPKTSVAEGLRHLQRWVLGGGVEQIVPEIPPEIEKVPA